MASARRALLLLIAAALALTPVGTAVAAGMAAHAPLADPVSGHHDHAAHHYEGAMQADGAHGSESSKSCGHDSGTCSCDDKAACAQTCLAKCFGQTAILTDVRTARNAMASHFADRLTDRPPDWAAPPQPPPPRT